jgi:hypothetical protein
MGGAQARDLIHRQVNQLLSAVGREVSIENRINVLSQRLLGYPYRTNPLIGSPDTREVFTSSLDGFDCVTYIETVLALARAGSVDDFIEWLRKIRYEQGRIEWKRRNHYMTTWIRNNVRAGIIRRVSTPTLPMLSKERVLNVVKGLAVRRIRVRCAPKRAVPRLAAYCQTGDLVFFVSTRRNLDVFHAGILVRDGESVIMRHASRSQGAVVNQNLSEFIKANRMAGVILARPQEASLAKRKAQSPMRRIPLSQSMKEAARRSAV